MVMKGGGGGADLLVLFLRSGELRKCVRKMYPAEEKKEKRRTSLTGQILGSTRLEDDF
jgi:hypothetical protein